MTDWDVYWELISRLSQIGLIIIRAYFLCRLVKPFLAVREERGDGPAQGRAKPLLSAALPGISYTVVMLLAVLYPREVHVIPVYIISTAAAFGTAYYIDRRNAAQKIFLAVVFYLLQWITWGITLVPWRGLYNILVISLGGQHSYLLHFLLYGVMEFFDLALHFFAMALCVRLIHREYHCKMENMTKRDLALALAPLFSVAAGHGIFYFAINAYEKDTGMYIWNHYSSYIVLQAAFMLISFAALLTVIVSYQRIKSGQRKEKEEAVLAEQLREMKRHIAGVEKLYLDIRSLKHDMGNHILTLEKLCEENEEAGKYIVQLKRQVREAVPEMKSGNPVTDVILREKKKEAEEKEIVFAHQFHFPEDTKLSAFDVSVILNNALDNAIEAAGASTDPYISVSSCRRRNAFMIEVKNSMAGKRRIEAESGLPVTTKERAGHGFGLVNIRKVAQKYYGDIAIEQEEGSFRLVIMLMV